MDIKRVGLDKNMLEKYEEFSVQNAIADMDDMGWCPIPTCGSIAMIEVNENSGRCNHCEHHFCIDCKKHVHPGKRCYIHRIDMLVEYAPLMTEITEKNTLMENRLNEIYFKNCTKPCPNKKCGAKIALISGGCS